MQMGEITAIPPMIPPAIMMAAMEPPECEDMEDAVEDAAVGDDMEVAVGDTLTPDVNTPEAPKIAPGPYSGPSI